MKNLKKVIVLLLAFLVLTSLYASDDEWFLDKTITSITFKGLQNVKEKEVQNLTKDYIGKTFTYDLFNELDQSFYSQPWLDYMTCDALRTDDENTVNIDIEIHENPLISSLTFNGNSKIQNATLAESISIKKNGYYSSYNANLNAKVIKDLYISKGYVDCAVKAETIEQEENNTVEIIFNIDEGKQYKVKNIVFENNNSISDKELKKVLTTKENTLFNAGNYLPSNIDSDKKAILSLYNTQGYAKSAINDVKVEVLENQDKKNTTFINLIYDISEGEIWTLGEISFSGNIVYTDEEINEKITIHTGDIYNTEKIQSVFEAIASLYYDNGYVYSSVVPTLNEEDNSVVSVSFNIVEGDQAIIEEIRINGLGKTKPYVFEREFAIKVGDVFSRADFIQTQQNMYNTSLLKDINAAIYPGKTENGVICEFDIEEGNQMQLQLGATFGATEVDGFPISGFFSLSNANLFGTGRSLSVSTNLSPSSQSLTLSLYNKWFKNVRWANGFTFSFERDVRKNSLRRGIGSNAFTGRDENMETYPLGFDNAKEWYEDGAQSYPTSNYLMDYDYYMFSLGYNTGYSFVFKPGTLSISGGVNIGLNRAVYDSNKFVPYEALIEKYNQRWQFSNKFNINLSWDGRNYVSKVPHGYVASLGYTYAGGILGGLSNYNKLSISASCYTGLFSYGGNEKQKPMFVTLGFKSEFDIMLPQFWNNGGWGWQDPKNGATRYEMLYVDGMNIGRGFNVVYDQALLWDNQLSLTFPLARDVISAEAFLSATATKNNLEDKGKCGGFDWRFALGAGIKMEIPGFPLGLYIVKNAMVKNSTGKFNWETGNLFSNGKPGSGVSLVLAITTTLF